jgi:hypothetical protein
MPRTRSYQEPNPAITVEYSASTLSRWGFFPVLLQYLRNRQLPQRLGAITIKTAANGLYSTGDKLMGLVTLFVLGIARISHVDRSLAGETALARTLGLKRFPSSDTFYTLLKRVTHWAPIRNVQPNSLLRRMRGEIARSRRRGDVLPLWFEVRGRRSTSPAGAAGRPRSAATAAATVG